MRRKGKKRVRRCEARCSCAHLLERAERVHLRGEHVTARKAAGCTVKRTHSVYSKARQSWLSLRARLPLAASLNGAGVFQWSSIDAQRCGAWSPLVAGCAFGYLLSCCALEGWGSQTLYNRFMRRFWRFQNVVRCTTEVRTLCTRSDTCTRGLQRQQHSDQLQHTSPSLSDTSTKCNYARAQRSNCSCSHSGVREAKFRTGQRLQKSGQRKTL
jgi:hypothetical protein